jgi:hypothetical protein
MFQRTSQLSIGRGSASDLIARLDADLASEIAAAEGFIAYYVVEVNPSTVISTRIFEDQASMDSETQASSALSQAIATDFELTSLTTLVNGDVALGIVSMSQRVGPYRSSR